MSIKVFLSSTTQDLHEYRQAIAHSINMLNGWQCLQMEAWSSAPHTSIREIQAHIKECDVFVGLIGHLHGSCPDGLNTSFTELEYRWAHAFGKPRLMFLASPQFTITPSQRETDDKFARQQAFRTVVSNDHFVQFFSTSWESAAKVVVSIVNWPTMGTLIRQIPTPPSSFYGRSRELDDIKDLVNKHARVNIYGAHTIGKSALIAQLAKHIENEPVCYDGQILVDF